MDSTPWWAASQNTPLNQKLGCVFRREGRKTTTNFLSFPNLRHFFLMADANMGGDYWRFFGFFEGDEQRYFDTFRVWDLEVAWNDLGAVGDERTLDIKGRSWRLVKTASNLLDCSPLQI